jgi:hypothetical protein
MRNFYSQQFSKLYFIFALFPYVSFGMNSMDSQLHFIVIGVIASFFLIISGPVFSRSLHLFSLCTITLIVLTITYKDFDFIYLRGIASYLSFYVALFVTITYLTRYGIPLRIIIWSNAIYLSSAFIQMIFEGQKNEIFSFLVISNSFGSPSRGVIGLTPEPTIFAILLFFFTWIILIAEEYRPSTKIKFLIFLNLFTILFFTKSSMAFVFLIVAALFFLFEMRRKKYLIALVLITFILFCSYIYVMPYIFPQSRFVKLSQIMLGLNDGLIQNILTMINFDASINDRMLNAIFPYLGLFFNNGLPGGVQSYAEMSRELLIFTDGFFWAGLGSNKILSYVGSFIYELGLIGIATIIYMYFMLKDNLSKIRNIELCLLFVLLNSSIPVAFPIIPIMMGLMYYKKNNHNHDI